MKITHCARCGNEHDLEMKKLTHCEDFTHFAMCPTLNEPIMIISRGNQINNSCIEDFLKYVMKSNYTDRNVLLLEEFNNIKYYSHDFIKAGFYIDSRNHVIFLRDPHAYNPKREIRIITRMDRIKFQGMHKLQVVFSEVTTGNIYLDLLSRMDRDGKIFTR